MRARRKFRTGAERRKFAVQAYDQCFNTQSKYMDAHPRMSYGIGMIKEDTDTCIRTGKFPNAPSDAEVAEGRRYQRRLVQDAQAEHGEFAARFDQCWDKFANYQDAYPQQSYGSGSMKSDLHDCMKTGKFRKD